MFPAVRLWKAVLCVVTPDRHEGARKSEYTLIIFPPYSTSRRQELSLAVSCQRRRPQGGVKTKLAWALECSLLLHKPLQHVPWSTPRNRHRISKEFPRGMSGDGNQEHSSVPSVESMCVVDSWTETKRKKSILDANVPDPPEPPGGLLQPLTAPSNLWP